MIIEIIVGVSALTIAVVIIILARREAERMKK